MAYRLNVLCGGRSQRHLLVREETLIGSAADCDLVLSDPTVSRRHARLSQEGVGLWVEDIGSRNGVFVDGIRIAASHALTAGSRLRLGSVDIEVATVGADDAEPVTQPVAAPPPVRQAAVPTLALSVLGRFCRDALPPLLAGLAHGDRSALPARLVDALCAQEGIGAAQIFGVSGAVLAEAGDVALADWIECRRSHVTVRLGLLAEDGRPGGERIAAIAADLLVLAQDGPAAGAATRQASPPQPPDPPTRHAGLARIYAQAAKVAGGDVNVLIEGESGTGKEVLARYLHDAGRGKGALIGLNCAALPRDLLDAELFGIEAGVATGVSARPGCFERAHGGTLFLDEIADMAADTQARLLRVLQERRVFRIGGREARPAEVRVVSASNRSLHERVQRGEFRLDLFHRIQDWCVVLPPLRERGEDIINLAGYFLAQECRKRGVGCAGIARAAADALLRYDWPGNVRELEREMRRVALFLDDGELVDSSLLKPEIVDAAAPAGEHMAERLAIAERSIIERTLAACGGNVAQAAERLGLGKSTLYRRIGELGLSREEGA